MGCISKAAFAMPATRKKEQFPLPAFGEGAYVVVQALTSHDLLDLQKKYGGEQKASNLDFAYDLFARSLVDDSGAPLFLDAADARASMNLEIPDLEAMTKKIMAVSGLRVTEDTEKN